MVVVYCSSPPLLYLSNPLTFLCSLQLSREAKRSGIAQGEGSGPFSVPGIFQHIASSLTVIMFLFFIIKHHFRMQEELLTVDKPALDVYLPKTGPC